MIRVTLALLILLTFMSVHQIQAQEHLATVEASILNVRSGPAASHPAIGSLNQGATVVIEARSQSADWLLIHTPDHELRGWVAAAYLTPMEQLDLLTLPESQEQMAVTPPVTEAVANPAPQIPAGQIAGVTSAQVNLRTGAGTQHQVIVRLSAGTFLILEGRNPDGTWLQVIVVEGDQRGWVSTSFVDIQNGTAMQLPAVEASPTTTIPSSVPASIDVGNVSNDLNVLRSSLAAVPTLYNFSTARMRGIFNRGRTFGNRARVFTTIGDSQSINLPYLVAFGEGNYQLLEYGYLQRTIDHFSISPREGIANSFVNTIHSQSTYSGGNAYTLQDPVYANPEFCQPGESPVACEFRLVKPSVAIILLGSMDVNYFTYQDYAINMGRLIQRCIDNGVIPVLTTIPISALHPQYHKTLQFNMVVVALSQQYNVPLINLWAATDPMPNHGVRTLDHFHLSGEPGDAYVFGWQASAFGTTARNLLTLQALDLIRSSVLR